MLFQLGEPRQQFILVDCEGDPGVAADCGSPRLGSVSAILDKGQRFPGRWLGAFVRKLVMALRR